MIQTESLCVHYGGQVAVRNASLQVPPGSITAIVGPSGCGKSSLLMALNRMTDLIPQARVTGRILIDQYDIHQPSCSAVQLRRKVGMIFQKPNPFPMSIRRNIQLALREHGLKQRDRLNSITEQVLQDVGLWDEVKERLEHP
ncbi:MAG: ATP-binding cassette domain-containing protein, partial [Pirellulales bacterium]|nr:ATP-binding cassette domain-containing protein [Pirellulales bacterium]